MGSTTDVSNMTIKWRPSSPDRNFDVTSGTTLSEEIHNNMSSTNCFLLQFEEFIPWNNPDNIVSFEVEDMVRKLKAVLFVPILFLIGFPANIINMAVFYKQGLKERVNVCLFALSLADGMNLLFNMTYFGEQLHVIFTTKETYGPVMRFITNNNLTGYYGFYFISQVLSAIIASERCFCVLQPLRSQTVLKASTMAVIVVGVYIVVMSLYFVVSTRYRVSCAFDPLQGITLMTIVPSDFYFKHQKLIDYLDGFVYGGALPYLVVVVVILTTIVTTIKLRQAAKWRAETSSRTGGLTQRDIALTKMLVANSAFFIVNVSPFCAFRLMFVWMPEMNTYRRHHNFYLLIMWIFIISSVINSTFNFIVYYTMGSRYRQTFWELLGRTQKIKSQQTNISVANQ